MAIMIKIDDITIQKKYYNEIVREIKKGHSKVMAIIIARKRLGIGLKEAKDLVEKISFIEEIPMLNGFQAN